MVRLRFSQHPNQLLVFLLLLSYCMSEDQTLWSSFLEIVARNFRSFFSSFFCLPRTNVIKQETLNTEPKLTGSTQSHITNHILTDWTYFTFWTHTRGYSAKPERSEKKSTKITVANGKRNGFYDDRQWHANAELTTVNM